MGLLYAVGVTSAVSVWPPDVDPQPPKRYSGVNPRRLCPDAPPTGKRQPTSLKALDFSLLAQAIHTVCRREARTSL